MSWLFAPNNPGIGGLDELTAAEEAVIQRLAGLSWQNGDIIYYNNGNFQRLAIGSDAEVLTVTSGLPSWEAGGGDVPDNLTDFVNQTAWRVFYSNGSGDVVELALGADGTFLKSNGDSAAPTFATPAGSGDVSKVGTPVNNEVAVWTGDGTLEGTSDFTYDGTSLNLITGKNFQIAGSTILTDAAGTTTLSNIDAIDATTEATIEAAIDTLANLTSIQGITVTLADAGANAFFGWDDTAGAYENLTAAEVEAIIEPLIDTLANLTSVQGLTITLADAGADALLGWDDSASAYQNLSAADARAALVLATTDSPQFASLTLTGNLNFSENSGLVLDSALSADGKYCGIVRAGTAGATLAFGDLVYLAAADSRWELADASVASTSGEVILGICVLAAASDGDPTTILFYGTIRADTAFPAMTISAPMYVSETAGDITGTQTENTDAVIRRVGFALTADELFFNPSPDYITHT